MLTFASPRLSGDADKTLGYFGGSQLPCLFAHWILAQHGGQ